MLIAGSVDLGDALAALAARRPVFHSEADFQFAVAWEVQTLDPSIHIYLETRPITGVHLDLAFERDGYYTAIELKYLTRAWSGDVEGQRYTLTNHSAHDLRRYDVVKDIVRVEKFIDEKTHANGAVVVLTNDPAYRRRAAVSSTANDLAFRIDDGAVLDGIRAWRQPPVGVGEREDLVLRGRFEAQWTEFSNVEPGATIWQLVFEIPAQY